MSARLSLSKDAAVAELHGEAVVLHLPSGRYFAANGTGAALLRRLRAEGGATRADLVEAIVSAHGVEEARAAADVAAWLSRLEAAGLLVPDTSGQGHAAT